MNGTVHMSQSREDAQWRQIVTHLTAFRAIFCLPTRATLRLNPTSSSSSSEDDESSEESTATTAATPLPADGETPLVCTAGLGLVKRDAEAGGNAL